MASNGFITFEEAKTHPDRVFVAGLRADDTTDDGFSTSTLNGANASNYIIDPVNGFNNNGERGRAISFSGGDATEMESNHYVQFELSTSLLTETLPGISYYLAHGVSRFQRTSGNKAVNNRWGGTESLNSEAMVLGTGKDSHFTVTINVKPTTIDIYYDFLLYDTKTNPGVGNWVDPFTLWYICGVTTTSSTNLGSGFMRNLFILKGSAELPNNHSEITKVALHGDSLTCGGGVGEFVINPTQRAIPWRPGNGIGPSGNGFESVANGSGDFGVNTHRDVGMTPTLFRDLSKSGARPVDNRNYSQSGANIDRALINMNTMLGTGYVPGVLLSNIGTNDVTGKTGAQFSVVYKQLIDAAYAVGTRSFLLWTIPSLANNPAQDNPAYANSVTELNSAITTDILPYVKSLSGAKAAVSDIFTLVGGASPDPALFQVDNIHFNAAGSQVAGVQLSIDLLKLFSTSEGLSSSQAMYEALVGLGFSGSLGDMTKQWLEGLGATTGSLDDCWKQVLDIAAIPDGGMNERKIQYYATQIGTTPTASNKSITELKRDFWLAQ